jgi:two-component system phosphate regulon sensor histidine kinase PhoR
MRMLIGFQAIILLAVLIGVLAVQQFSVLTTSTTKLNSHDLPEFIAIDQLRSLLFQQRHSERSLVAQANPDRAGDLASLAATLQAIDKQRSVLHDLKPGDTVAVSETDPVAALTNALAANGALAQQVQSLAAAGTIAQARAIEQSLQEPLLQRTLDQTTALHDLEQNEVANSTAGVQQQSSQATWLMLGLIVLFEPLAILAALALTRSLTRPLSALLQATRALAAGNLEIGPQQDRADEIGELARAFDTMRSNLRTTITTLGRERRQTQAIIDASADGIVLVDANRAILRFNPAAERLSGWTTAEALGRPCWEVFGCHGASEAEAADHQRLCPVNSAAQSEDDQVTFEVHAALRNGTRPWFAMSCAMVSGDGPTAAPRLAIGVHDISQHKAVEQLKSDFVAMVSHELRAPLTTVTGSVEMLGQLDPAADPEAYREVLGILEQQTQRLRGVIEEVLQLTRFEAGHLAVQLHQLAPVACLEALLASVRLEWTADERPLQLVAPDEDVPVWADRSLLELVVRNLLDNARKYTPAGSPVQVEVRNGVQPGRVEIRVLDRGPGIAPAQLERIFERFTRAGDGANGWSRGYGLGLYIARELIRAQSGEIWAMNRPEGGACFVISLWSVQEHAPVQEEYAPGGSASEQHYSHD